MVEGGVGGWEERWGREVLRWGLLMVACLPFTCLLRLVSPCLSPAMQCSQRLRAKEGRSSFYLLSDRELRTERDEGACEGPDGWRREEGRWRRVCGRERVRRGEGERKQEVWGGRGGLF